MSTSFSSSSFDISCIDSKNLKIQIIAYDSYQCAPSSIDKQNVTINGLSTKEVLTEEFEDVPIIRIYGRLQTGHTCLLHVHNIFPYLYIPYQGPTPKDDREVQNRLCKLLVEINKKLKQSFQRKDGENLKKKSRRRNRLKNEKEQDESDFETASPGSDDSNNNSFNSAFNFVSDLSVVKGVPFYNYSVGSDPFVKISLLNPRYTVRLSRLLSEGAILGHKIQPFEAHIRYNFQFLLDYNCYSCNWISLSQFFWRSPLVILKDREDYQLFFDTPFTAFNRFKITPMLKKFMSSYIFDEGAEGSNILDPDEFPRIGRTLVELDASASWIENRKEIAERPLHLSMTENEALKYPNEKYISSTKAIIADVMFLRKERSLPQTSKLKLFDDIKREFKGEKWVEIEELRKQFEYCYDCSMKYFKKGQRGCSVDETAVIIQRQWLQRYPTSFESVCILQYTPKIQEISTLHLKKNNVTTENILDVLLGQVHSNANKLSQAGETFLNSIDENQEQNVSPSDSDGNIDENLAEMESNACDNAENPDLDTKKDTLPSGLPGNTLKKDSPSNTQSEIQEKKTAIDAGNLDIKIYKATQTAFKSSIHREFPKSQMATKNSESFLLHPLKERETTKKILLRYQLNPPRYETYDDFLNSFEREFGMLKINYKSPYYSDRENYDNYPFYFAGKKFNLNCLDIEGLAHYQGVGNGEPHPDFDINPEIQSVWRFTAKAPNYNDVHKWLLEQPSNTFINRSLLLESEIEPITQKHTSTDKRFEEPIERKSTHFARLITLIMELHITTRKDLQPDPAKDPIGAIFWNFDKSHNPYPLNLPKAGIFLLRNNTVHMDIDWGNILNIPIRIFDEEEEMISSLVGLVELVDPDILSGYEIHAASWGYLIERCKIVYDIDLTIRLSRVCQKQRNKVGDPWGYTHASAIRITGRHMLNIWRQLRRETNLGSYSVENVTFQVLGRRIPHYSTETLTQWFTNNNPNSLSSLIWYYYHRIIIEGEIIEKLEIIEKITEQSRLLGIDFYSVIYRGSQYKVESLLVRLAKAEDYILISPSKKQVFNQDSLECIPLVLEPESALYRSPLVVLDFQSLYPSIIIAYNYCFSTLLGKMRDYKPGRYQKLGVTRQKFPPGIIPLLKDLITLSPNGLMFVKSTARKSLLAKLLTDILDARLLVKGTMRSLHNDHDVNKIYNNRQLALKMIANVTYGYTSATFSGRMPHSALADAVVSSGRETLLRAASEIESNPKWGAKVVYGDTDSLFVYLPGKTRADAFRMGTEMASYITHINPAPVKLKFEKVYHPSVLVSKKRYVGWKYEFEDQKEPIFDAKGIETVRRDGIPAQQKIMEKAITILFKTMDISAVKKYVCAQFSKIMRGQVNYKDFIFAKEVRLGTYKNEAYLPPGARVSKRKLSHDHRAEPQYKERVKYIVKRGFKGEALKNRCMSPDEFLKDNTAELDAEYYITKVVVPPLERIFNLMGVDVRCWYNEMPKYLDYGNPRDTKFKGLNINYRKCILCNGILLKDSDKSLCPECAESKHETVLKLQEKLLIKEKQMSDISMICGACSQRITDYHQTKAEGSHACENYDCPLYYKRERTQMQLDILKTNIEKVSRDW